MKVSVADTDLEPLWEQLGPSDLDEDIVREEREAEDRTQRPGLGISGSSYMAFESSNTTINNYDYNIDKETNNGISIKPNHNFANGAHSTEEYITPSSFVRPKEKITLHANGVEDLHMSASTAILTQHDSIPSRAEIGSGNISEGCQTGEFTSAGDHKDEKALEYWRRILVGQQFLFNPNVEDESKAFSPKNSMISMPENLRYLEFDVTVEKDWDEERLNICLDEDLEAWRVWFG